MKYFSMFSGIGGFELGIKKAWEYIPKQSRIRKYLRRNGDSPDIKTLWSERSSKDSKPQNIGYSEIDKYAIQIYERHFPTHKNYGDATKLIPEELPDFDFLTAGFPCQSFSIAGKRKGFDDTRGTLFFDICRVLRAKRPSYCLLENVKGLLSHDEGQTFQVILESLDELGYDCQWQVLNSKYFGVPQNRERVFIIGHLREIPRPEVFPIGEKSKFTTEKSGKVWIGAISDRQLRIRNRELIKMGNIGSDSQGQRVYNPEGISAQIVSQGGGQGAKTGLYVIPKFSRTLKTSYGKAGKPGNANWKTGKFQFVGAIRRLTPLECERLQGFPDSWTEGVSDTQRYKCLGNAVTVNVVEFIMQRLAQEVR